MLLAFGLQCGVEDDLPQSALLERTKVRRFDQHVAGRVPRWLTPGGGATSTLAAPPTARADWKGVFASGSSRGRRLRESGGDADGWLRALRPPRAVSGALHGFGEASATEPPACSLEAPLEWQSRASLSTAGSALNDKLSGARAVQRGSCPAGHTDWLLAMLSGAFSPLPDGTNVGTERAPSLQSQGGVTGRAASLRLQVACSWATREAGALSRLSASRTSLDSRLICVSCCCDILMNSLSTWLHTMVEIDVTNSWDCCSV